MSCYESESSVRNHGFRQAAIQVTSGILVSAFALSLMAVSPHASAQNVPGRAPYPRGEIIRDGDTPAPARPGERVYDLSVPRNQAGTEGERLAETRPPILSVPEAPRSTAPRPPIPARLWTDAVQGRDRSDEPLRLNTFANLAERLSPAVVNIDLTYDSPPQLGAMGVASGQGSGFFIHRDGYVITNAHVVARARTITVTTNEQETWNAEVVGVDDATDLALLVIVGPPERLPAQGFPVAALGDSSRVRPGEWVVAIGNPFGLQHSVTAGIVSALGRREIAPGSTIRFADFIQFDAAINFGNSGGPLINVNGEVIGVNSAIRSGNDIGFAIPINMVKTLLPQLAQGEVVRAWMGASLRDVTTTEANAFGWSRGRGAHITYVAPGGPAALAGLLVGDVVVGYETVEVRDAGELRWLTAIGEVGHRATLRILRNGAEERVELTLALPTEEARNQSVLQGLGASPRPPGIRPSPEPGRPDASPNPTPNGVLEREGAMDGEGSSAGAYGLDVADLDHETRERLGIGGVMVRAIADHSPARIAGFGVRVGDVVTHVGQQPVESAEAFYAQLRAFAPGERVMLTVFRGGALMFFLFVAEGA